MEAQAEPVQPKVRKLPASAQLALRALEEALEKDGKEAAVSNYIPPNTRTVSVEFWRACCYGRGISDQSPDAARVAFSRAFKELQRRNLIGVWQQEVWIV